MEVRNNLKNFLLKSFVVLFIYLLDRISKIYILHLSKNNFENELFVSKYLNITPLWNSGISFGIFSLEEGKLYHLLTVLIGIIILVLVIMAVNNQGFKKILLLIIIGGALGNFHDRIQFNAVLDFIDFHVANFHWFIFNVSDIFITLGVTGMIILELTNNNKKNQNE